MNRFFAPKETASSVKFIRREETSPINRTAECTVKTKKIMSQMSTLHTVADNAQSYLTEQYTPTHL